MLEGNFEKLYLHFRANYYRRMVEAIGTREGSLSATEGYCVEIIYLLKSPTVGRFASFLNISVPNAIYKINSLVKKGYVIKEASKEDRREYHLHVTEKFLAYYGLNNKDNASLMKKIRQQFTSDEVLLLDAFIEKILNLMEQGEAHD